MGALAWVEVLDRTGHVKARHRVESAPALVGRGYGCDILLDDPWISPIHLRVYREIDGSLSVEDAGSENGLWSARGERVTATPVGKGVVLRAGRSLLRVVPADAPVPTTLGLHIAAPGADGLDRPWLGPALGLLAAAMYAWGEFLDDADDPRMASIIGDALVAVALIAVWAGIWSLVTRATSHRARFSAHLTVISVGTLASLLVFRAVEYAAFLTPGTPAVEGIVATCAIAVAAAILYGHLMLATTLPRVRAVGISVAITFGLAALGAIAAQDAQDDSNALPEFSAEMKPLSSRIIPTEDTTAFFAGTAELKAAVDSIALDAQ